jgi:hypothetical protein
MAFGGIGFSFLQLVNVLAKESISLDPLLDTARQVGMAHYVGH